MNKKIVLLSVLILVGCATKVKAPAVPIKDQQETSPASGKQVEQAKKTVEIDPELLKPCEDFKNLLYLNPTPNQVLEQKADDVAVHKDCAARHRSLIKIVKDAFNIP